METPGAVVPRVPPPKPSARKPSAKSVTRLLLFVVLGGLLGYLGTKVGVWLGAGAWVHGTGSKGARLLTVFMLPLAWLVAVAAHEFGHLLGGWAGGGKFLLYVVGPFKWQRTPTGIRFAWNRSFNLAGGMAACMPFDVTRITPRRMAGMIAGGPLASLLLAVAGLGLAAAFGAGSLGQALVAPLVAMSLLIFGVTIFPSTLSGFKSDGRRFFELLRGDQRSDQEKAMMALTTAALTGVRPADLDVGLVAQAIALRDGSIFDLYAHFTAYQHAIDRGEAARAQALLDYVVAGETQLVPFVRDAVRCEYAWLLATRTSDVAAARAWLDSAGRLDFDPNTRLRAEAAVLLAEGRTEAAATAARAGLHALKHQSMSPVENPFARDALEAILQQAERPGVRA